MLSSITGRLTDIGLTPSGKTILVHHFTFLLSTYAAQVNAFQVVQEAPDLFVFNIVPGSGFEKVRRQIIEKTQEYLGSDVELKLVTTNEIPTTSAGKRRLFISRCGIRAAGLSFDG